MNAESNRTYFPLGRLATAWQRTFGDPGGREFFWARAPGRVNLIGEHTDYHDGFVFPVAIDLATYVLAAPRTDGRVRIHSLNFDRTETFDSGKLAPGEMDGWVRYPAGTLWAMRQRGLHPKGLDAVAFGVVPLGGGLSSSASLEIAFIALCDAANGWNLAPAVMAEIGRSAENGFVGVPCGIMDQFASAACRPGAALMLDCRNLDHEHVSVPQDWRMVICDTGVRHELAASEYGKRQEECRVGLEAIRARHPEVKALRDVSLPMLEDTRADMPEISFRRCGYVIRENGRVAAFADALRRADETEAGKWMAESHAGLRDEYEVSSTELDRAVELAAGLPGRIGSRMTGGGFGGCTVNLVRKERAEEFRKRLEDDYRAASGGRGGCLILAPGGGAAGGKIDRTNGT